MGVKTKESSLTKIIMISLVAGVVFGWLYPKFCMLLPEPEKISSTILEILRAGAQLFLQMIKMIIAPLVFSTLVVGIAGHGNMKTLGNLGSKTIIYFLTATSIALVIGLVAANVLQPGVGCEVSYSEGQMQQLEQIKNTSETHSITDMVTHVVPKSVIGAMSKNEILQIVVFSIFFALALGAIGDKGKPVLDGLRSLSEVMFKFTEFVMNFAPFGVFTAIAATIGENGISILFFYAKLIGSLYLALTIFVATVLITVCSIIKVPFMNVLRAIKDPALLSFSTASSEAALPKAMETMEEFGVPKKIVGFVMPTGYTFNLDGSTLYLSLAAIFIAQMYGIEMSLTDQLVMMLALMLASKGMAAVPRVSLVILAGTLGSFGIPLAGVAVLLGIDHILDMGRTTVNLIGNCVATVAIARWENEFSYRKMYRFMAKIDGYKSPILGDRPAKEMAVRLAAKQRNTDIAESCQSRNLEDSLEESF